MTEGFYTKFLDFALEFLLLIIVAIITVGLLVFFVISHNPLLSYGYVASVLVIIYFGAKFYKQFREFKDNLYLFLPSVNTNHIFEGEKHANHIDYIEFSMLDQSLPLEVCRLYSINLSLSDIAKRLGLDHPEPVKRLLIKGLKELLEEKSKNS